MAVYAAVQNTDVNIYCSIYQMYEIISDVSPLFLCVFW